MYWHPLTMTSLWVLRLLRGDDSLIPSNPSAPKFREKEAVLRNSSPEIESANLAGRVLAIQAPSSGTSGWYTGLSSQPSRHLTFRCTATKLRPRPVVLWQLKVWSLFIYQNPLRKPMLESIQAQERKKNFLKSWDFLVLLISFLVSAYKLKLQSRNLTLVNLKNFIFRYLPNRILCNIPMSFLKWQKLLQRAPLLELLFQNLKKELFSLNFPPMLPMSFSELWIKLKN